MITRFILAIATIITISPDFVYGAPKSGGNNPKCESYLIPMKRRVLIRTLFALGLDDDSATVGYFGLDQGLMEQLILRGSIEDSPGPGALNLNLTTEHPAGARLILTRSDSMGENWARESAIRRAKNHAVLLSQLAIIKTRVAKQGRVVTTRGAHYIWQLLMHSSSFEGWKEPLRIGRDLLLGFLEDTDIPYEEPTFIENTRLSPDAMKDLNSGPFYDTLATHQKLLTFAREIGFPEDGLGDVDGESFQQLLALFKNLPVKSGYVVGITPAVLREDQDWEHQCPGELQIADITGIEPLGQSEYSFMEKFARRRLNPREGLFRHVKPK